MRNKIFIVLFLGCFLNVFSQSHVNYPQDGIYGGLESGVAFLNVNGTFNNGTEFIDKGYTKSVVSINLGYGLYIGESFAGIEAHYSAYTKKVSDQFTQDNINFDISIGSKSEIDIIIGRKIGVKSLLTLRGGIAFSNINVTANYNAGSNIDVLDKKWNGYSIGMGYVYGINQNISIKSKYTLTTFKNNELPNTDSKFVDNRATLSIIYNIWN